MLSSRAQVRHRLDARYRRFGPLGELTRPHMGWVRAIRDALGMSGAELARRMGVSQQSIPQLERNEQRLAVKLDTLARAADALDCELVYALVPRSSLTETVREQARRKAVQHLRRATQHSRLEDQQVSNEDLAAQTEELAEQLEDRRGLWSDGVHP